ncbi:MAG TPA: glycosyltransferase [candidate division Zixibacteria bacterium]|nr:glycosyltransferase [candidate division Zixibacteria bacterium]
MRSPKILILACNTILAPRVDLERLSLQEAGYELEIMYRSRIKWNLKVFTGMACYYVKAILFGIRRNISIIHLTHISQLPLSLFYKLLGRKIVYDSYEKHAVDISEKNFSRRVKPAVNRAIELLENIFVRYFVDAVLVVSTFDEYLLTRFKRYCKIVECLYNVPESYAINEGDVINKFNDPQLNIVYAGSLITEKGLNRFIPLAIQLRKMGVKFRFHLVGSFANESDQKMIIDQLQSNDLFNTFVFHGHIDYFKMITILKECHVGLTLHSLSKRFKYIGRGAVRKNFEYMAAGMVVITSNIGQLSTIIREENCGIIIHDPDDIAGIVKTVQNIDVNRKMAIAFATRGLLAVKSTYNWNHEQAKLLRVYAKLSSP